jgi:hypothetical protein
MQALGQFILYGDGPSVRVHDMARPGVEQRTVIPGIDEEAGDGLGAVKLASGETMVVVGPENGSNSTSFRFWLVAGSLASPPLATYVGAAGSSPWSGVIKNMPNEYDNPLISENISVIPECGTGDIYIVNAVGDGGLPDNGLWRLSKLVWNTAQAGPTVQPVNHAFVNQVFRCHLRSAGSVWTDTSARMHFYCHERAVARNTQLEDQESVAFSQREMGPTTPPSNPPNAPCCERNSSGVCTLYAPVGGECP